MQEITLNWGQWTGFEKDNYICLKDNYLYKQIEIVVRLFVVIVFSVHVFSTLTSSVIVVVVQHSLLTVW